MSTVPASVSAVDQFAAHIRKINERLASLERAASSGGGGVTDHGALTGLGDDDHPQYLLTAEGNALYQPLDADLTAIAALASAADRMPYATGAGAWALATLTAAGRALLDDADAAAQRTTLGLGALNSGDGALDATHTPTFTNVSTGTSTFRFIVLGRLTFFIFRFNGGTVTAAGQVTFTLPSANTSGLTIPCMAENAATQIRAAVQSGASTVVMNNQDGSNFAAGTALANMRVAGFYY